MRRRELVTGLAGAALAWPLAGRAQQPARKPRIGVLTLLSPKDQGGRIKAFVDGMRELGYIGGQTIDIDFRYGEGDTERLRQLASELLAQAPQLIFAGEPSAARAVKSLAPNLPIVCPVLTDRLPDLFSNYARPGGSVTGVASIVEGLSARLVGVLQELTPAIAHIGLLINPAGANSGFVSEDIAGAARIRGIPVLIEKARTPEQLSPALDRMVSAGADIVIIPPNGMFINHRNSIVQHAISVKLPTLFQQRQDVEAGGLISYGVNETEGSLRAATFVDKILRGAKPGDLPIEFPTKIELVINVTTARTLGLTIPASLLARADEVIE